MLRDYQSEIIDDFDRLFARGVPSLTVTPPTASAKTVIASLFLASPVAAGRVVSDSQVPLSDKTKSRRRLPKDRGLKRGARYDSTFDVQPCCMQRRKPAEPGGRVDPAHGAASMVRTVIDFSAKLEALADFILLLATERLNMPHAVRVGGDETNAKPVIAAYPIRLQNLERGSA
jgi:hypothetical protein